MPGSNNAKLHLNENSVAELFPASDSTVLNNFIRDNKALLQTFTSQEAMIQAAENQRLLFVRLLADQTYSLDEMQMKSYLTNLRQEVKDFPEQLLPLFTLWEESNQEELASINLSLKEVLTQNLAIRELAITYIKKIAEVLEPDQALLAKLLAITVPEIENLQNQQLTNPAEKMLEFSQAKENKDYLIVISNLLKKTKSIYEKYLQEILEIEPLGTEAAPQLKAVIAFMADAINQFKQVFGIETEKELSSITTTIFTLFSPIKTAAAQFVAYSPEKKAAVLKQLMNNLQAIAVSNENVKKFIAFLNCFTVEDMQCPDFPAPDAIAEFLTQSKNHIYTYSYKIDGSIPDLAKTQLGQLINLPTNNMPESLLSSALAKSKGLVFLQDHYCSESCQRLIDNMASFKTQGVKHLYLELDERHMELFVAFNKTGDSEKLQQGIDQIFIQDLQTYSPAVIEEPNHSFHSLLEGLKSDSASFYNHIVRLAQQAYVHNIKIYPIDQQARFKSSVTTAKQSISTDSLDIEGNKISFLSSQHAATEKMWEPAIKEADTYMVNNIQNLNAQLADNEKFIVLLGQRHKNIANKENLNVPTYFFLASYFLKFCADASAFLLQPAISDAQAKEKIIAELFQYVTFQLLLADGIRTADYVDIVPGYKNEAAIIMREYAKAIQLEKDLDKLDEKSADESNQFFSPVNKL